VQDDLQTNLNSPRLDLHADEPERGPPEKNQHWAIPGDLGSVTNHKKRCANSETKKKERVSNIFIVECENGITQRPSLKITRAASHEQKCQ
jgi:hypothetical protein